MIVASVYAALVKVGLIKHQTGSMGFSVDVTIYFLLHCLVQYGTESQSWVSPCLLFVMFKPFI